MKKFCKSCNEETKFLFGDCQPCEDSKANKKRALEAQASKVILIDSIIAMYENFSSEREIARELKISLRFVNSVVDKIDRGHEKGALDE